MMLRPKIIDVKTRENYQLWLKFDTNEEKLFDVTPYISGDWYGKLKEPSYFQRIRIEGNTVVWIDGQDIAPHELYDNGLLF